MNKLDQIIEDYKEAVFDTDRQAALEIINEATRNGITPEEVVFEIVIPTIHSMMENVSSLDTNLAQHFIAAQIAAEITEVMTAKFPESYTVAGSVVIGTSAGDLHGLGKRIVTGCLKAFMIDVTDLGLNVSPERFVDEAVARGAEVIGISSMMVHTARGENGCLKVRQILRERGLEQKIKIAVGGAPYRFDHNLYKTVQADAWAEDGIQACKVIMDLIEEVHK
ncbi:MAG: cobalamin B12-binding domain-containing protein [Ignavibacteriales bacterium]|nr:cobalamin B12-binding domain-containing protein [Ignavibacteriales bacterium]